MASKITRDEGLSIILQKPLETEVKSAYKTYAIETIKERAIPSVKDGFKPIHRKSIYTMWEMGLNHNATRRKNILIAGAVLKYSVHGNISVEGALNIMTAEHKTLVPYCDGQGNFGSVLGDSPASGRYCVTGDTLVYAKGIGPISHEELAKRGSEPDEKGYIDLSDLNLMVKGPRGEWVPCKKMIDSGVHSLYKITLHNGMSIRCTPNHPVLVSMIVRDDFDELVITGQWVRADRLSPNHRVFIDNNPMEDNDVNGYIQCNDSVKSIEKLKVKERVYSLVIDTKDHSYITNGIVSHNTENRLSNYTDEVILGDLTKGSSIIDWDLNYDDTLYEPAYLPCKLPNLLINGCPSGVAVGFVSRHVPHNPLDVIDATVAYIKDRNISIDSLVDIIKGPDFPTGGVINGMESIYKAYTTGKGSVLIRGKWKVSEDRGYTKVSIYEVPYDISTPTIHQGIAALADNGTIKLVKGSLHDHSDIKGVSIDFLLKKDEDIDHVMNNILKNTALETRIPISTYVIDSNNDLKLANLKDIISEFIITREETLNRKFKEEIKEHNDRIHLLNGLVIISSDMDTAISIIRKSKGKADAREKLMKKYKLDENQANYILNMAVYRLSSIELKAIIDEVNNLKKRVSELIKFTKTKSNKLVDDYMIKEMLSFKDTLFKGYKRKTKIQVKYDHISSEEIIRDEPATLIITRDGYVKKYPNHNVNLDSMTAFNLTDGDEVVEIIRSSEAKTVGIITNKGNIFGLKVHNVDDNKRGTLLRNLIACKDGDYIVKWWNHNTDDKFDVLTLSDTGMIKNTSVDFSMLSQKGKSIMNITKYETVVGALVLPYRSYNKVNIAVVTKQGQLLSSLNNPKPTGIPGLGNIGIKLKPNDTAIGITCYKDKLAVVSQKGVYKTIGKEDIPTASGRNGFGVIVFSNPNDKVAGVVGDMEDTIRCVVKVGNGMFYDFYLGDTCKRTAKGKKINIPSDRIINNIIVWR